MSDTFRKGQQVIWDWGGGTATGTIRDRYVRKVTRRIKGSAITRNGDVDNPAYLIVQEDGDEVLKLASELRPAR
ncbi:DUF2945 domain-containing protein [Erythrobacter sp. NE805]|uniref:DUF2945 domain-containing protein n=1 Tax=Erythrobacter sp. NE805 TaxID=3389875 RepID=UPI00396B1D93